MKPALVVSLIVASIACGESESPTSVSAPAIWLLAGDDRLIPTRVCLPIIEALKADGHRFSVHTYAGLGHELGGTSIYWADVAAWLTSEGLR